jgi:hypothetical protein
MKSISIMFKKKDLIKIESWIWNLLLFWKHYFQHFFIKNSKSSTYFSIYDFEFAFNELNIKN